MPAMIYTSPFGERVYAQIQGDILTVQNGGGSWNPAGAQYIRVTEDSLHMSAEEPKVATNIKHGSASQLQRLTGRKSANWSLNAPIAPSGTPAVPPDVDPLLQNVFGGPGGLRTGTLFGNAWQYNIYDRIAAPMTLFGFQHNSAATGNRYALGCLATRMNLDFNGNIFGMGLNGVAVSQMSNEAFPYVTDLVPKGGLGAFPGEPGSFSANGGLINAFGGALYINGQQYSNQCDSLSVEYETGYGLKGNMVDSAYPVAPVFNWRSAMVTVGFVNNDSTQLALLKVAARLNTPINLGFYLGTIPGYRVYVEMNGVQFVPESLSDSQGYVTASFGQSPTSVLPGQFNDIVLGFA